MKFLKGILILLIPIGGLVGAFIFTSKNAEQTNLRTSTSSRDNDSVVFEILNACFEPNPRQFAGSRKAAETMVVEQITQAAKRLRLSDADLIRDTEAWARRVRSQLTADPYYLAMACFAERNFEDAASFAAQAYSKAVKSKDHGRLSARAAAHVWAVALMELHRYNDAVEAYDKVSALTDRDEETLFWVLTLEAKAYALWQAERYPEMEDTLRKAVAGRAAREELCGEAICYSLVFLGESFRRQSRLQDALTTLQEALDRMAGLPMISPVVKYETLCTMAQLVSDLGAIEEALSYLMDADSLAQSTGQLPGLDPVRASFQIGTCCWHLGRFQEAAEWFSRSIAWYEKSGQGWERRLAICLSSLANARSKLGLLDEAITISERVVSIMETAPPGFEFDLSQAYDGLGVVYCAAKKYREAESVLRKAVALMEEKHGPDASAVAVPLGNLSGAIAEQGRWSEAEPMIWDVVAMDMRASVTMGRLPPTIVPHARQFIGIMKQLGVTPDEMRSRFLDIAVESQMPLSLFQDLESRITK